VLVATDIAARGIDIDDLGYVINYELPNIPETYVHRIGRTGRAGASGIAFSFCEAEEREYLRDIQKLIKRQIPVIHEHPFAGNANAVAEKSEQPRQERQPRQQPQGRHAQKQPGRQPQQAPVKRQQAPMNEKPEREKQATPPAQQQKLVQAPVGRQHPQPDNKKPVQQQGMQRKFKKPTGPLPMPAKKEVSNEAGSLPSKHVPNVTPLFDDDDRW